MRGVGKAAELIDLKVHQGAHPRMGAADVVPFIPIEGVTLEDCVPMARHVGQEIWKRYQIPVYFYEAARLGRSGRIWKTSGAASSKGFARRLQPIRRAGRISAIRECIRRRARRWSARESSWSLTTFI